MNINRDNYEEFFVLYIDKELSPAARVAVEKFVEQNPDLKTELEMLTQTILPLDEMETFANKDVLLRNESEAAPALINDLNCEEFFVMYGDNELNNDENALVEEFVYRHPQYQEHFELIQQVKFQPEKHILFPDKSILYRSENDVKVVPMFTRMRSWKMVAAAALILVIGGTVWYALNDRVVNGTGLNGLAKADPVSVEVPVTDNKKVEVPVADNKVADNKNVTAEKVTAPVLQATGSTDAALDNSSTVAVTRSQDNKESIKSGKDDLRKLLKPANQSSNKSFAQSDLKKENNQSNIVNPSNVKQGNEVVKTDGPGNEGANTINGLNKKDGSDKKDALKKNKENDAIIVPVIPNKDEALAIVEPERTDVKNKVAIGPVELKSDNVFTRLANETDEEFEQSDKKNKMRGIFRKVTRVFDKATSREPAESRKDVRIASFSIGLK